MTFDLMTVFTFGISMHALATHLEIVIDWNYNLCISISGLIVLVYILNGGLTSAIYNGVQQFFLIVLVFLPLVLLGLMDIGDRDSLMPQLICSPPREASRPPGRTRGLT